MAYLLDANVFITAKDHHYGLDFCPGFWRWLEIADASGRAHSVGRVYDELTAGDDALCDWARAHQSFFLLPTEADYRAVADVNQWANDSPGYDPAARAQFAKAADSFLVAQAKAGGHTVVSHERSAVTRKRVKIPDAAAANGVQLCTPFEMLRAERARFVLEAA